MPKEKLSAGGRRISLLRTAAVIGGMLCIIHLTHRECSRTADRPFKPQPLSSTSVKAEISPEFQSGEKFNATAYCLSGITVTGHRTRPGIVSADPEVIPLGSLIYVDSPLKGGIYQVLDTGDLIKGKIIDIFIPSYEHCKEFGRRIVKVTVLRYGFDGKSEKTPDEKQ
jgi:3D (Asp-Asp-Asp) domain-containing protein